MPNGAAFHIANAWLLPLAAILALLMLPVDLRAGLRQSHPHAIFQIIDDAADGAIDHDHDAVEQGYGVHHHDHKAVAATANGLAPDLPRVSDADSGVGFGLTAAMLMTPLPAAGGARTPRRVASHDALWRESAQRPPIPPPRPTG